MVPKTISSLGRTVARLARHVDVALSAIDLSTSQYRMLVQHEQGAEASTSLARKLAVSAPSVTAVVDGLVQRGAIERTHSKQDRRKVSLELTEEGRALLAQADAVVQARMDLLAESLGDAERARSAIAAVDLWAEALDAHRA